MSESRQVDAGSGLGPIVVMFGICTGYYLYYGHEPYEALLYGFITACAWIAGSTCIILALVIGIAVLAVALALLDRSKEVR